MCPQRVIKEEIDEKIREIKEKRDALANKYASIDRRIGKSQGILISLRRDLKKFKDFPLLPDEIEEEEIEGPEEELEKVSQNLETLEEQLSNFGDSARACLEKEEASIEAKINSVEEQLLETEGYTPAYLRAAKSANELRKAREHLFSTTQTIEDQLKKRKKAISNFYSKKLPKGVGPDEYREYVRTLREEWKSYLIEKTKREKVLLSQTKAKEKLADLFQTIRDLFSEEVELRSPKTVLTLLAKKKRGLSPRVVCPCCENELIISEGTFLLPIEEEMEDAIEDLEVDTISSLETSIKELIPSASEKVPDLPKPPPRDLEKEEATLEKVEILQVEIRSMEAGRSPLITQAKTTLQEAEDSYSKLDIQIDPSEITDEDVATYENMASTNIKLTKIKEDLEKKLQTIQKKLKLSESMESLLEEVSQLREKKKSLEELIKKIEETEVIRKIQLDRNILVSKIEKEEEVLFGLETNKTSIENMMTGLRGLKVKIREAMLQSIEDTINSINKEASKYLRVLFINAPITITLGLSSKSEGKVEVQVSRSSSTAIKYDDLSDGERQRARFSFFLGINDYLGPRLKLLIIDESLNQVEEALNSASLDLLTEREGTKIVISHEALAGKFDKVIDFEKK